MFKIILMNLSNWRRVTLQRMTL